MYATIYVVDHFAGEELSMKDLSQFSAKNLFPCNMAMYQVGYHGQQAAALDPAQLRPSAYHSTLETFSDCLQHRILGKDIRLKGKKTEIVEGFVNGPSNTDKSKYRSARPLTIDELKRLNKEVLAALKKK